MSELRKYTPEEMAAILEHSQVPFYRDSNHAAGISISRIPTIRSFEFRRGQPYILANLPFDDLTYYGPMYHQGIEPTCFAWSVANAVTTLGAEVHPELLAGLLNKSWGDYERNAHGFNRYFADIFAMMREYGYWASLSYFGQADPKLIPEENLPNLYHDMANLVKKLGDKKNAVIILASRHYLSGPITDEGHALCIAGYHNHPLVGTRVQVLDSNGYNAWAPLELIAEVTEGVVSLVDTRGGPRKDWYQKPDPLRHQLI